MISMKRSSRGERPSATTTRYVGCFFFPTRIRRIFTATEVVPSRLECRRARVVLAQPGKVRRVRLPDPSAGGRAVRRGRKWRKLAGMATQDLGPLTYDVDGPVARIALNDPGRANSQTSEMVHAFDDALTL